MDVKWDDSIEQHLMGQNNLERNMELSDIMWREFRFSQMKEGRLIYVDIYKGYYTSKVSLFHVSVIL